MDHSAILPNGKSFEFWEVPVTYKKEIHVNQNHPMADDANEGTLEKPLKTINAAAKLATAGGQPCFDSWWGISGVCAPNSRRIISGEYGKF